MVGIQKTLGSIVGVNGNGAQVLESKMSEVSYSRCTLVPFNVSFNAVQFQTFRKGDIQLLDILSYHSYLRSDESDTSSITEEYVVKLPGNPEPKIARIYRGSNAVKVYSSSIVS